MSEVSAKAFLKKKEKMLKDLGKHGGVCDGVECHQCPFYSKNNGRDVSCFSLESLYPGRYVKLVMGYECKKVGK